jgi:hypothetical protein
MMALMRGSICAAHCGRNGVCSWRSQMSTYLRFGFSHTVG